jgi:signal transduction histidine kinase/CheY-like chemotaxis protein
VEKDDNFPRAPFAVSAGFHAAFAFPILLGDKFLGVMEFFSHEIREPDDALLAMFGSIGGQIGQFMERKRNEDEREQLLIREFAARTEAEQANRTKDEFLAIVSHELRTPLNAIVGWASMLRSGSLDEGRSKRAIEVIDRNAKAQAQLIEDILDVSRIVSGNLRLRPLPVHLQQVIESAVDSVRPMAEAKRIKLRVMIDPNAGPVSGDSDRLQQVVWNLLSNAVKFTPTDGVVSISLTSANSHAAIVVSDTGQGIDPEFLPHVFDRFRQADGSKTRRHGGLGLGLAIVRNLVELHRGVVWAQSEGEGKGSTFTIKLPYLGIENEAPRQASDTKVPRASPNDQHELSGVRILSVEDDTDSREMLDMVLRSQGADVISVGSVREALKVLKGQWGPEILVSDIGMPDQDGYDLIRQVRSLPERSEIPAIAITGYAGNEEGKLALAAGFQKHLTKPVNWQELIKTIAGFAKKK